MVFQACFWSNKNEAYGSVTTYVGGELIRVGVNNWGDKYSTFGTSACLWMCKYFNALSVKQVHRDASKPVRLCLFFSAFGFTSNKVSNPKIKGGAPQAGSWLLFDRESSQTHKNAGKKEGVSLSFTAILCCSQFLILPIITAPSSLSATVRASREKLNLNETI